MENVCEVVAITHSISWTLDKGNGIPIEYVKCEKLFTKQNRIKIERNSFFFSEYARTSVYYVKKSDISF